MSEANEAAERFKAMAANLERNGDGTFGGAFVVVPPKEGGEPLETLILDSRQDPAQFWLILKTKCEMEIANIDAKQRQGQAFGRR